VLGLCTVRLRCCALALLRVPFGDLARLFETTAGVRIAQAVDQRFQIRIGVVQIQARTSSVIQARAGWKW
jgi:hypothetical protein